MKHAHLLAFLLFKRPVSYKARKAAITAHFPSCDSSVSNFAFEEARPDRSKAAAETMHNDVNETESCLDN